MRRAVYGPDPTTAHPIPAHPRVCFLKPVVDRPNIEIGEYTYYDDPVEPERFAEKCVLHHYEALGDRLVIGRFCAIAAGARFIMNGANHGMAGISTYPFQIFGNGWERGFDVAEYKRELRGDTIVGNDVWIGSEAMILPGVRIGDGAVIGTRAVVGSDVSPYAITVSNPARVIRRRFSEAEIEALLKIAWWNWDIERISRNISAIRGGDIAALAAAE